MIGVNINITTMMIGEKCADLVSQGHGGWANRAAFRD